MVCEEYEIGAGIDTCAEAGPGGLFNDGDIKLCLDVVDGVSIQLDSDEGEYFVSVNSANIFGDKSSHYKSITVDSGNVVLTTIASKYYYIVYL